MNEGDLNLGQLPVVPGNWAATAARVTVPEKSKQWAYKIFQSRIFMSIKLSPHPGIFRISKS